jgi:hypothetical protein
MNVKNGVRACALVLFTILFFAGQLPAQMNPIYRFKKVMIPLDFHIKNSIFPKGEYDLEFLRVPNPLTYYVRIMKKGKILHLLQGQEFRYDNSSVIPKKPTLKMSKNRDEKILTIVFESGSHAKKYPLLRASFSLEYEED